MLAIESLNDPEHGTPSKSEFLAVYNITSVHNTGYGFTLDFKSDADAIMFLLRFA